MKKIVFLIGGIAILTFIFLLLLISSFFFSSGKSSVNNVTTPTPITTNQNTNPLSILTTDPLNNQTNVPINQIITITFNKNVLSGNITFTIQPSAQYVGNIVNNQYVVNLTSNLLPNTQYTYTIHVHDRNLGVYTFTTAGSQSGITNDNAAQTIKDWSRTNKPDMFLYNQTPYSTSDFSVSKDISQTAPYNAFFTVSLLGTDKNSGKQAFLQWLTSLGLTDQQIQNLDIRYQQ